jgi:hypothetical protein
LFLINIYDLLWFVLISNIVLIMNSVPQNPKGWRGDMVICTLALMLLSYKILLLKLGDMKKEPTASSILLNTVTYSPKLFIFIGQQFESLNIPLLPLCLYGGKICHSGYSGLWVTTLYLFLTSYNLSPSRHLWTLTSIHFVVLSVMSWKTRYHLPSVSGFLVDIMLEVVWLG